SMPALGSASAIKALLPIVLALVMFGCRREEPPQPVATTPSPMSEAPAPKPESLFSRLTVDEACTLIQSSLALQTGARQAEQRLEAAKQVQAYVTEFQARHGVSPSAVCTHADTAAERLTKVIALEGKLMRLRSEQQSQ